MKVFQMNRIAMACAFVVCAMAGLATKDAAAASRWDIGVGFSTPAPVYVAPAPVYVAPAPYYSAPACEGHYESRVERVLVAPERTERRWIAPQYETRYYYGQPQTVCISQGMWQSYCVPAQYENRYAQVWVPGCAVTYYAPPRYYSPAPNVGFGFDFNYRSRR